ncbi:MAG TPA: hypothetical protein VMM77_05545 [Gemmatimonadaceae bacterium]|nr:hypothetical protein [Gemmatimonadaceae bacterium]
MRSLPALLCAIVVLTACNSARRQATLSESDVEVHPAQSASIIGDWVLANGEQTQFVGATLVELRLQPGTFTVRAQYPGESVVVVQGSASFDPAGGLLTLTPSGSTSSASSRAAELLPAGQSVVVLATAADNTMVFAEPRDMIGRSSSIWHRSEATRRAGLGARLSQRDSTRVP